MHSDAGGINAGRVNITAEKDISLLADQDYVGMWTGQVRSTSGNITLSGTSAAADGVIIDSTALTALNGTITLNGSKSGGNEDSFAAINMGGNTSLSAVKNIITATSTWMPSESVTSVYLPVPALAFKTGASISLAGDSDITARAGSGVGVLFFGSKVGNVPVVSTVSVSDGHMNLNASVGDTVPSTGTPSAAFSFENYYVPNRVEFILSNASISINADASESTRFNIPAFAAATPQATSGFINGFTFTGAGNVSVTGKSYAGDGVNARYFDNTNLNGSLSVTGSSVTGTGVNFDKYLDTNLVNATVSGDSVSGVGILLASNSGSSNLNGNILTGTSATGQAGLQFIGQNVTLTNGTLTGTVTSGDGSGVVLSGGNGYTLDGVSVNGTSVNGTGVSVSGNLALNNNASLAGNATGAGSGVSVKGNLSSSGGVNICGTATTGDGVTVAGDTSLVNATLKGQADSGNGVNIAGNLTTDRGTTVTGQSTSGTGVNLGASLSGGTVTGISGTHTGLQLSDKANVAGSMLSGSSTSGNGVVMKG
ncbi:TPA: hypothetical protein MND73_004797, partial [Salmonella enterica subsp. houtenae]|nr:hypothetical protein [Salmonella enterica subsp. houtenae]